MDFDFRICAKQKGDLFLSTGPAVAHAELVGGAWAFGVVFLLRGLLPGSSLLMVLLKDLTLRSPVVVSSLPSVIGVGVDTVGRRVLLVLTGIASNPLAC